MTRPVPQTRPDRLPPPGDVARAGTSTLSSPSSGSTVPGPTVTVSGTGTAFEATMAWDVHPAADLSSPAVAAGSTTAGSNGEIGPFSFTVDLPPGTWTVRVWEPDVADDATAPDDASHLVQSTFRVT
ncbi:Gmad2 immunoglobulin-like domain-containing protein [Cellulomonas sp. URHB0016]